MSLKLRIIDNLEEKKQSLNAAELRHIRSLIKDSLTNANSNGTYPNDVWRDCIEMMVSRDRIQPMIETGYTALYEENGSILGVGMLIRGEDNELELKNIYISPKMQGKGIGKAILKNIEERASLVAKSLYLDAWSFPNTLSFYQKMGYNEDYTFSYKGMIIHRFRKQFQRN